MNAYTLQQTADRLGLSTQQVKRLIESEALHGYDARTPGAKRACYRVTGESIETFITTRSIRKPAARIRRKRAECPRFV